MRNLKTLTLGTLALATVGISASSSAELIYGVSFDNQLITFDSLTPDNIESGLFLQGLGGADVAGIDFRPATGELYVLGTNSALYTADLLTGQLTQVNGQLIPVINGTTFGFDFNPTVDRIRIASNTQQNLRANPAGGAVIVDGNINVAGVTSPRVSNLAYTNNTQDNFGGTTTLYGLESKSDTLVVFSDPNSGTATVVGSLGFAATGLGGFDISGLTGTAYAAVQLESITGSRFYTIDLATGASTLVGAVGGSDAVVNLRALTVAPAPVPEPASMAVLGLGALGLLRRRAAKKRA